MSNNLTGFINTNIDDPALKKILLRQLSERKQAEEEEIVKKVEDLSKIIEKELGIEVMPDIVFTDKGTRSAAAILGSRKVIKVNRRLFAKNKEYIIEKAIPVEFARLVSQKLTSVFERSSKEVQRIKKILIPIEQKETEPEVFTEYLYCCECKTKWLDKHRHHQVQKCGLQIVCNECKQEYAFSKCTQTVEPEVIVKVQAKGLLAYKNDIVKTPITKGSFFSMSKLIDALSQKGYNKVIVAY